LIPFFFITVPSRKPHHACAFAVFFIADAEPEVNCQSAIGHRIDVLVFLSLFFRILIEIYDRKSAPSASRFRQVVAGLTQFFDGQRLRLGFNRLKGRAAPSPPSVNGDL
jgi:hypothetical protein